MYVCVGAGKDQNASQFYITTGSNLDSLDEKHTIFGQVAEGWDVLEAINDMPCDEDGRPLQNVRYVDEPDTSNHEQMMMMMVVVIMRMIMTRMIYIDMDVRVCAVGYGILLCWMIRHQP